MQRIARTGRFAEKPFFGCSGYPGCRYIEPCGNDPAEDTQPSLEEPQASDPLPPTFVQARPLFEYHQTRFLQTLALPLPVLKRVVLETDTETAFRYHSKWRVDYPLGEGGQFSQRPLQALVVTRKILTRGDLTLCSPFVEEAATRHFAVADGAWFKVNPRCCWAHVRAETAGAMWFDGLGTERTFYNVILRQLLGPYFRQMTVPQVEFSSLVRSEVADEAVLRQRVDFLVTLPTRAIAIEIDGADHIGHETENRYRAQLLRQAGIEVVSITNGEVEAGSGPGIDRLRDLVTVSPIAPLTDMSAAERCVAAVKIIHQLQVVVVEALQAGFLAWDEEQRVAVDCESLDLSAEDWQFVLRTCAEDLKELLEHITRLYGLSAGPRPKLEPLDSNTGQNGIAVTWDPSRSTHLPLFVIQDVAFPTNISLPAAKVAPATIEAAPEDLLKYFLHYIFRYKSFRDGQYEAIARVLASSDVIALLPTGGGKSLAFQLSSMLLPGVTVVIDPIIALIDDQIDNLRRVGITRTAGISAQISDPAVKSQINAAFGQGEYLFCYIAPERFQTREFRGALRTLTSGTPVAMIVVDEAHCVSEWGHDFRTAYLNIGRTSREYCRFGGRTPPLVALTGTASAAVLRDVQRELEIESLEQTVTPTSFDRPELTFSVVESTSEEKVRVLDGLLRRVLPSSFGVTDTTFYQEHGEKTFCGIVFCPWVNGDFGVRTIASHIKNNLGIATRIYSGKPPRDYDESQWSAYKKETARGFKDNRFPVLVATKSFGMGIDKPNIRYTIHLGLPSSIEAFYQEAGRAGRGPGLRAECVLMFSNTHPQRNRRLLAPSTDVAEVHKERDDRATADDVTRALYFHKNAFKGIEAELNAVRRVLQDLGDLARATEVSVVFTDLDRLVAEKAIHRLLTLGVVRDYTIAYSAEEFTITLNGADVNTVTESYTRYVRGYSAGRVPAEQAKITALADQPFPQFVVAACRVLLEFVYDTIERGRRRALREMLALAEVAVAASSANDVIHRRVLSYLESTFTEELEAVLAETGTLEAVKRAVDGWIDEISNEVIGGLRSRRDADRLRGQTARYLESYPDHPGLLMLRAVCELLSSDRAWDEVYRNVDAAIASAIERYDVDSTALFDCLGWLLVKVNENLPEEYAGLVLWLLQRFGTPAFARSILQHPDIRDDMIYEPGLFIFGRVAKECLDVIQ